jgi:hypothetical protein
VRRVRDGGAVKFLGPAVLALLVAVPSVAAPPVTEASLAVSLAEYSAGARFPLPELTAAQLKRLLAGKVVKVREALEEDSPQRAIGLIRSDLDRESLWLATRDPHMVQLDELTEQQLTPPGQWPAVWYQLLDLPRPFSDRHWVIDVTDTHTLATASENRCWEHAWVLSPEGPRIGQEAVEAGRVPGITPDQAAAAIYTPVNHGAWLAISLADGGTVLGYHATSVIGGRIPDKLVADYTMLTLGNLLRGVIERVPEVLPHYDAAHLPIEGADGQVIDPTTP